MPLIRHHWELEIYKIAMEMTGAVFRLSKRFPREEMYSPTDQIRRSSRAVSAIIAEGWRRRKYLAAFVEKMNQAEGESAETEAWLEHAVQCEYLPVTEAREVHHLCNDVIGMLVRIGNQPEKWILNKSIPSTR